MENVFIFFHKRYNPHYVYKLSLYWHHEKPVTLLFNKHFLTFFTSVFLTVYMLGFNMGVRIIKTTLTNLSAG